MSIKVKGFLKDVGGASRVTEWRRKSIAAASAEDVAAVSGIGAELAARIVETARRNVGNAPPENRV